MNESRRNPAVRRPGANDDRPTAEKESSVPTPDSPQHRGQEAACADDEKTKHERVAVAAYFLAERRGFAPGGDLDDWLRAEVEIEASSQPAVRAGQK